MLYIYNILYIYNNYILYLKNKIHESLDHF